MQMNRYETVSHYAFKNVGEWIIKKLTNKSDADDTKRSGYAAFVAKYLPNLPHIANMITDQNNRVYAAEAVTQSSGKYKPGVLIITDDGANFYPSSRNAFVVIDIEKRQ